MIIKMKKKMCYLLTHMWSHGHNFVPNRLFLPSLPLPLPFPLSLSCKVNSIKLVCDNIDSWCVAIYYWTECTVIVTLFTKLVIINK